MNIAQLLHNHRQQQTIPHWPTYTIEDNSQHWHFYSAEGRTLRKKLVNTSIVSFLNSSQNASSRESREDNYQSKDRKQDLLLVVRQIDRRQPRQADLYTISVTKLLKNEIKSYQSQSSQQIIRQNQWKARNNERVTLYRIQNVHKNQIWSLQWSQNLITCNAPISQSLKDRLNEYCELICQKSEERILKGRSMVRDLQLVFTYDHKNGKIKIIFAHNFVLMEKRIQFQQNSQTKNSLSDMVKQMYWTDYKIGKDDYERVQLKMSEQNLKQINPCQNLQNIIQRNPITQEQIQLKRLKYIKTLKKLTDEQNQFTRKLNIAMKHESTPVSQTRQFQCQACHSHVVLGQFQTQKTVTSNRIPQIQILRQVKMKTEWSVGNYQLVGVCELCYGKFKQIVQGKNMNKQTKKQTNDINKTNKAKKQRIRSYKQNTISLYENENNLTKQQNLPFSKKPTKLQNFTKQTKQTSVPNTTKANSIYRFEAISQNQPNTKKQPYLFIKNPKISQQNRTNKNSITFQMPTQQTINKQLLDFRSKPNTKSNQRKTAHSAPRTATALNKTAATVPSTYHQPIRRQSISIHENLQHQQQNRIKQKQQQNWESETNDQLNNALAQYEQFGYKAVGKSGPKMSGKFIKNMNRKWNKYRIGEFV